MKTQDQDTEGNLRRPETLRERIGTIICEGRDRPADEVAGRILALREFESIRTKDELTQSR